MLIRLTGTVAVAALLWSASAVAQGAPPGVNEPATPLPGTAAPPQATGPLTEPSADVPEIVAPAPPTMDRVAAESLLGRTAVGGDGEELGEVQDVILNARSGEAEMLVISSGGFMGLGEKPVAVDISDAELLSDNSQTVQIPRLTTAQVERMAEYQYEKGTLSLARGQL